MGGVGLNVSVVGPTAASYLTLFPAGANRPLASNLNWVAGQAPTPNAVTVNLSADGKLSFYNLSGTVDVVVDVNGYYTSSDDRYYTKAQVDTALAGKADAAHNHDDRYLQQNQPIVIGEPAGAWRTASTSAPTTFEILGPIALLGATGVVPPGSATVAYSLPLTQPALVGGTAYKLSSVEYCLRTVNPTVKVDSASIFSDDVTPPSTLPLTAEVIDNTDVTLAGCYTVSTSNGTARAYALVISIAQVSGTRGGPIVSGVRSTWIPV